MSGEQPLEFTEHNACARARDRTLRFAPRTLRHAHRIRKRRGDRRLLQDGAEWAGTIPCSAARLLFCTADSISASLLIVKSSRSERHGRSLSRVSHERQRRFHFQETAAVGYEIAERVA